MKKIIAIISLFILIIGTLVIINFNDSNDKKVKITISDINKTIYAKEGDKVNIGTIKKIKKIGFVQITVINDFNEEVRYYCGVNYAVYPDSEGGEVMYEFPLYNKVRFDLAK